MISTIHLFTNTNKDREMGYSLLNRQKFVSTSILDAEKLSNGIYIAQVSDGYDKRVIKIAKNP